MAVQLELPLEELFIGNSPDDILIIRYVNEAKHKNKYLNTGIQYDGRITLQMHNGKLLIEWSGSKPVFRKQED